MDMVVANFGFDNVGIFIGYGDNSFANQTTYSMGLYSTPRMVAVGDFNNDNRSDIAVANFGTHRIVILFGNGNGSFLVEPRLKLYLLVPSMLSLVISTMIDVLILPLLAMELTAYM